MDVERSELSIERLREIIGSDYRQLRTHQEATLEYLREGGGVRETLLEHDSFIPRKRFRDTGIEIHEKRYQELMKLCGNVALYNDEIEELVDENELVAATIELKRKLPDDQRAINAFRACRSVAILGVVLSQDAQDGAARAPMEDSEEEEIIQVVA